MHPARTLIKRCAGIVAATLATTWLLGCGQGESNVAAGNRDGVLHIGNGTEPQTLDPHVMSGVPEVQIARALFEGLVRRNGTTMEMEPGAAQRWEYSGGGHIITFYLNPKARWSNGDPLTAEDFSWSLRRSMHPEMGNELAYSLYPILNGEAYASGQLDNPDELGVIALDEHTLQITLAHPNPEFLQTLGTYPAFPVHRATLEAHGRATDRFTQWTRPENLVGNGPFVLSDWQLYRQVSVRRSETYWDADAVKLNAIVFYPTDNEATEEKMFRSGQLHHTSQVPISKIAGYRQQPNSPYHQAAQLGTYYYAFNIERPPVNDLRVRQALALAIDRDKLIATVLAGTEQATASLTPPGIPGYTLPVQLGYDPQRARALLAAAGYPDGQNWPELELLFNTNENHRRIAVAIQQMWKEELNIEVTLTNQEWKVFLDTKAGKRFTLAREGWLASVLNPEVFLDRFTTHGGTNYTGFSNARYDEIMLQLAPATGDPKKRMQLMHEAESLLLDAVPLIPLYTYNSKHLVQPSVRGAQLNVLDIQDFKRISLDPDVAAWKGEE